MGWPLTPPPGSYRRHALICIADVWQCTTTGFVFTANARAIPSATSDSSRMVMPSAPNERAPCSEIRIGQLHQFLKRPPRIAHVMMHADRAVHPVVGDDDDRCTAVLRTRWRSRCPPSARRRRP